MSGSTRSYELALGMIDEGYAVTIFTADRDKWFGLPRIELVDGMKIVWMPCGYSNKFGRSMKILSYLLFTVYASLYVIFAKYNFIYATSTPLTIGIPALIAKKIRAKNYIFEVRDLWPEMPIAVGAIKNKLLIKLLKTLEEVIYLNSSSIVALSPGMLEGVRAVLNKTGKKTPVYSAPNWCRFERMETPGSKAHGVLRDKIRSYYSYRDSQKILLYAGTLGLLNDIEFLIALARETKSNVTIQYMILGGGIKAKQLKQIIINEGLSNITFVDFVPKSDIPAYYAACDIGLSLFSDIKEMEKNSASKFFDTLAAGKPVFVNYGGWQADFIYRENVGLQLSRDPYLASKEIEEFLGANVDWPFQRTHLAAQIFSWNSIYNEVSRAVSHAENHHARRVDPKV